MSLHVMKTMLVGTSERMMNANISELGMEQCVVMYLVELKQHVALSEQPKFMAVGLAL